MSQVIVFQSLSSSGATSFVLNLGIGILQFWKDKKVLLISSGQQNNIPVYCAKNVEKKKEGFVFSGMDIKDFEVKEKCLENYDYIIVDLDRSASTSNQQFWHKKMDIHIGVLSLMPSCFAHANILKTIKKNPNVISYTFLNLVRGLTDKQAREYAIKNGVLPDVIFPYEAKTFWKQVFMGVPVLSQRSSRWGRCLSQFTKDHILHA